MSIFSDRREAGKLLAEQLLQFADKPDVLVLALPRGGVPVAFEVAKKLKAPLDIFIVRKLGVPGHEELAMGAIATGGIRVMNEEVMNYLDIHQLTIEQVTQRELREIRRREEQYRGNRNEPIIKNKDIIIIDDGLATGSTMKAGIKALKLQKPASITVGVPVADPDICNEIGKLVEQIVCLEKPTNLIAVGKWYQDFSQTTDEEVIELLHQSRAFQNVF